MKENNFEKDNSFKEKNDNRKEKLLNKKISVKSIDPTLSLIEYKIIKRQALFSSQKNQKNLFLQLNEIKNNKNKNFFLSSFRKFHKRNLLFFSIKLLLILCILCMTLYSLILSIIIWSEWNLIFMSNDVMEKISSASLNLNLSPAYFFQYFFDNNGHIQIGISDNLRNFDHGKNIQALLYAHSVSNYSISGFGAVSYYRFMNGISTIPNHNILDSSINTQFPKAFIIQISYSLFGLLLCFILSLIPSKFHKLLITFFCVAIIFIII